MTHRRIPSPILAIFSIGGLLLQATAQTPPGRPAGPPASAPPQVAPAAPRNAPAPAPASAPAKKPVAKAAPVAPMPQVAPTSTIRSARPKANGKLYSFKFEGADLDTVMETYCEWTGKIYLKNDTVKATITLKANALTKNECIEVVEAILGMNNIALVPMGDKFIKVVQSTAPDLGGQGLQINMDPEQEYGRTDKLVTQIIQLKNVEIPEVQTAIQHLMHAYGKIQTLERSNSLMITDTEANILRIRELLEFLDQATARIEPHIYKIKYAEATEIASTLNEIISAAQGDQKSSSVPTTHTTARTPPGVIRASRTKTRPTAPTQATISKTESGNAAIIQGTVKVLADERTNIIMIFSQKENFEFFDGIIEVLDVEVEPTVNFEVINLEYADAEELSGTLNELVGASRGGASSSHSASSRTANSRTSKTRNTSSRTSSSKSRTSSRITPRTSPAGVISNLNSLSENTKILADQRSNSILLMGEKADIEAIKGVIKSLDVMLEQVMIEAAIFEVTLGDDLKHGIQWLYKSQGLDKMGSWDGVGLVTNAVGNVASGALTYYQALSGIDTELAIKLSAGDSNVRLLSTPVIMTTDNTEAHLSVGEQRPVVTSTSTYSVSSGTRSSNYEYKDIGIQLTVTPRINPQRNVVMEILQQADQVGDEIKIDGNNVPVILNREFEAQVSVPDRGTVALGGLVNNETRDTERKIPILGDIPFIGRYLFSSVSKENRQTELVVLLTPYVLTNNEELQRETERRYDSIDMQPSDWPDKGWSDSKLRLRPKPETDEAKNK